MADWTVGLFFGRASAELGQLGHPPPLGSFERTPSTPSEHQCSAESAELMFREGRPADLRATFALASARWPTPPAAGCTQAVRDPDPSGDRATVGASTAR